MPWSSAKSPQQQTSQLTQAGWEKPQKLLEFGALPKTCLVVECMSFLFCFFWVNITVVVFCQIRMSLTFNDQDLEKWGRRDEKKNQLILGRNWWVWTSHRESYHGCSPEWLEILPTAACPGKYRHFTCHKVVQMGILLQWPSKSWSKYSIFFWSEPRSKTNRFFVHRILGWVDFHDWDLWNQNSVV